MSTTTQYTPSTAPHVRKRSAGSRRNPGTKRKHAKAPPLSPGGQKRKLGEPLGPPRIPPPGEPRADAAEDDGDPRGAAEAREGGRRGDGDGADDAARRAERRQRRAMAGAASPPVTNRAAPPTTAAAPTFAPRPVNTPRPRELSDERTPVTDDADGSGSEGKDESDPDSRDLEAGSVGAAPEIRIGALGELVVERRARLRREGVLQSADEGPGDAEGPGEASYGRGAVRVVRLRRRGEQNQGGDERRASAASSCERLERHERRSRRPPRLRPRRRPSGPRRRRRRRADALRLRLRGLRGGEREGLERARPLAGQAERVHERDAQKREGGVDVAVEAHADARERRREGVALRIGQIRERRLGDHLVQERGRRLGLGVESADASSRRARSRNAPGRGRGRATREATRTTGATARTRSTRTRASRARRAPTRAPTWTRSERRRPTPAPAPGSIIDAGCARACAKENA